MAPLLVVLLSLFAFSLAQTTTPQPTLNPGTPVAFVPGNNYVANIFLSNFSEPAPDCVSTPPDAKVSFSTSSFPACLAAAGCQLALNWLPGTQSIGFELSNGSCSSSPTGQAGLTNLCIFVRQALLRSLSEAR